MPEGDTLQQLARALRPRLLGQAVVQLSLRDRGSVEPLRGARVEEVGARGKNLVLGFSTGHGLRLHLGMKGKLRRYPPGGAERHRNAVFVLATAQDTFVCAQARLAELFRGGPERHPALRGLGPDLAEPGADFERVLVRARAPASGRLPVGELLLEQAVAAGIGNVVKSEALFLCGQDPFQRADELPDPRLRGLFECASALLCESVERGRRVTVSMPQLRSARPGALPAHWVYGRQHKPCLRCATPIHMRRQGDLARSTYYCPSCQHTG